jgi:antitoxin MazE
MKTRLLRIGNSPGIRIPKAMIEQAGIRDEVEISVVGDMVIIRAAASVRNGWAEAFQEMARRGGDVLFGGELVNEFDETEWEW